MGLEEALKKGKNPSNCLLNNFFLLQNKKLIVTFKFKILGWFLFLCNEVENGD